MAWTIRPYNHGLTETFHEIYPTYQDFKDDYEEFFPAPVAPATEPKQPLSEANLKITYMLLYGRYGLTEIKSMTLEKFKTALFSIIFQYGPTWEARLKIQDKVRDLVDSENFLEGSKVIYNHAFNPSTEPSTSTLEELEYINEQNTTNYKKDEIKAYAEAWDMIVTDVTEIFINKFASLFSAFVNPFGFGYYYEEEN